jgi:hypothetical protein
MKVTRMIFGQFVAKHFFKLLTKQYDLSSIKPEKTEEAVKAILDSEYREFMDDAPGHDFIGIVQWYGSRWFEE